MLTLPADYAGQGVNELTLFTPDGRILAERLFWREPDSLARVDVRQNRAHYGACSPVVLKVSVPRYEDYGSNVRLSMAVREAGSDIVRRAPGIREQLLLSSSVRGYVERPEYYLSRPIRPIVRPSTFCFRCRAGAAITGSRWPAWSLCGSGIPWRRGC